MVVFGSMLGSTAPHDEHGLQLDQDCVVCRSANQPLVVAVASVTSMGDIHPSDSSPVVDETVARILFFSDQAPPRAPPV